MEKTENYNLNKPEPTDPMRVEDFNENAEKIDAALGGLNTAVEQIVVPKIVCGTYTGNGAASQTIELGFTPKAVLVVNSYGQVQSGYYYNGGLAVTGSAVSFNGTNMVVEINEHSFSVYQDTAVNANTHITANINGEKYNYIAIG